MTISARAEGTLTRFAFPPEWEADRLEAIRILADLPQNIRDADAAFRLIEQLRQRSPTADRHGIGGNHPPEWTEDLPSVEEVITEATVAREALLTELRSNQPHLASIRLASRALKRVGGWIKGLWQRAYEALLFLGGVGEAARLYAEAKRLYHDNAETVHHLVTEIDAAIAPIAHLFSLLHPPL